MIYSELKTSAIQCRKELDKRITQRDLLIQQQAREHQKFENVKNELWLLEQVNVLLQKTSDYARNAVKHRIESIVTQALSVIFGRRYVFRVEIKERAGRVECDYYLFDGQVETKLEKPDYDRGGGVIDGVSLALLLALGELRGNRGPLFLDEVGKHISAEFAPNVAYFLKQYSQQFNRQIVLVTHNQTLAQAGDIAYRVHMIDGKSEVAEV